MLSGAINVRRRCSSRTSKTRSNKQLYSPFGSVPWVRKHEWQVQCKRLWRRLKQWRWIANLLCCVATGIGRKRQLCFIVQRICHCTKYLHQTVYMTSLNLRNYPVSNIIHATRQWECFSQCGIDDISPLPTESGITTILKLASSDNTKCCLSFFYTMK